MAGSILRRNTFGTKCQTLIAEKNAQNPKFCKIYGIPANIRLKPSRNLRLNLVRCTLYQERTNFSRAFLKNCILFESLFPIINPSNTRLNAIDSPQNETVSINDTTISEVKSFKSSSFSSSSSTNSVLPESQKKEPKPILPIDNENNMDSSLFEFVPPGGITLTFACLVGLLTGGGVVLFNDTVHVIHDYVWIGVPESGATWIRTQSLESTWQQLLFVPIAGGIVVGGLNEIRSSLEIKPGNTEPDSVNGFSNFLNGLRATAQPFLKALSAAVTLGTGNSLGPEGPSVEIGASVATGVGNALRNSRERKTAMLAAGSAAGISSGFNAAVSGCFFAVENVLRTAASSTDSLTTAMILLASVLASVVSQAGLGSDPAFLVPAYEFRSPAELPLYLLLGILCGGVSIALVRSSSYATKAFDLLQKKTNIPSFLLPSLGGLCTGIIALFYPEILYWGFENVNELLESRPLVYAPPAALLVQLVGAKIVATALCRGSGLVGGVYAPSLFIGAALGSAYGRIVVYLLGMVGPSSPVAWISVAAPQAYALVSMAAVLAGVCQVPLTSVLLLFELTRDYRIILPLMATVGLSSWIASTANKKPSKSLANTPTNPSMLPTNPIPVKSESAVLPAVQDGDKVLILNASAGGIEKSGLGFVGVNEGDSNTGNGSIFTGIATDNDPMCLIDDSLCLLYGEEAEKQMMNEIRVEDAMRSHYACVKDSSMVKDALEEMTEKQEWCCLILGEEGELKGLITLVDIQQQIQKIMKTTSANQVTEIIQSLPITSINGAKEKDLVTILPHKKLKSADRLMTPRGLRQLPVVEIKNLSDEKSISVAVGLLDREAIGLACRVELTKRLLGNSSVN